MAPDGPRDGPRDGCVVFVHINVVCFAVVFDSRCSRGDFEVLGLEDPWRICGAFPIECDSHPPPQTFPLLMLWTADTAGTHSKSTKKGSARRDARRHGSADPADAR